MCHHTKPDAPRTIGRPAGEVYRYRAPEVLRERLRELAMSSLLLMTLFSSSVKDALAGVLLPVHGSLDNSKVRWPLLAGSITFPDMGLIIPNLVVKCVVDGDGGSGGLIDPVHMKLELEGKRSLQQLARAPSRRFRCST